MACWLPLSIEGEPVPKLFKLAFDSLRRQRERTAFTIVGLALAIATVVLVFAISLRFESSSTDSLLYVTQGGNLWMVPALGFDASNRSQFIQTNGRLPADAAAKLRAARGVTDVHAAIVDELDVGTTVLAIFGRGDHNAGSVVLGRTAADVLHATPGGTIAIRDRTFRVAQIDDKVPPTVIEMAYADLAALTKDASPSWLLATVANPRDFAATSTDFTVTSDPSVTTAGANKIGLAYALNGQLSRFDVFSFKAKFGASVLNKATSTIFGQIARITLLLGFFLAISSALMTIEERRVEFGILAAVGITDDVLYLFLAESGIVFLAGFLGGVLFGGLAYGLFLPALFDANALLKSVLIVSTYLPAMLVMGALIPLNRLLQRSPLELLRQAA